ncbi:glycosyltransferase [Methylobacter sp.]|uniref:glycosyltransferase n=1 Tax=Methylobacter sp. TaxID=2051955 RepID=UPI003DA5E1A2
MQKNNDFSMDRGENLPLVTVIIRSTDRPTLSEALDSVAQQAYPNIEVLVVNAKGEGHAELGEWCGHFPLRVVNTGSMLRRSLAANIGLSNAAGDYLIFLDDDDWFMPEHIAMLMEALIRNPDKKVAYSCVMGVNEQKEPCGSHFCQPFDRTLLLAGNYLPIHSALFSRSIVDAGCRMDESVDLYEDWDFWLQAAAFGDFIFVAHFSAYYRIGGPYGQGVRPDAAVAQQASADLFEKWRKAWKREDLLDIMAHVREHKAQLNAAIAERDAAIAARDAAVAERDAVVAERDAAVAGRDAHIAALYNTTSWRITQPLRVVSHQLKRGRRAAELIGPAIRRGGGVRGTLNKAMHLYRHEGLTGIRHGFRIVALSQQISPAWGSGGFDRNDYAEWIRRYDTLTDDTRATMNASIAEFAHQPLISVVMPTYNPKPEWLIEAIESVRKQIYPHWELCIADDASTDKAIRSILERYASEDLRIKVVFREINGHISEASNSALELASGEWAALLDHDDLLSEHALFWVVDAINQNPDAHLIYSDEDKVDEVGKRFDPYFKCDWNADLFYSQNMISHLGVYRTDLLNSIGGFRKGMEGSQDYDLVLRCIERIQPKQIHHIPRVLYHWRKHAESAAQSINAKPYALLAGERALNEHFQRQGINATASPLDFGMYRVRYALPDSLPMVSLIIPTRNGLQLIRQCVESIRKKTTYLNYEILIVDNGSDDPATLRYFDELQAEARAKIKVVRDDRPFNYSALNNAAVKLAQGEIVGLLNNDLEVISPDWLSEMVSYALQADVGSVGAKLWYPDNTLQHGGVILGVGGVAAHAHKHLLRHRYGYFGRANLMQSFSAVTAACLVIRKAIYEEVGGFNETNLQIAFNDVDFCLRVRKAGYRNVWTPHAQLFHHESATRGYEDTPEKRARFARETQYMKQCWGNLLLNDPAYSPNLTLDFEDFSLAWPPRTQKGLTVSRPGRESAAQSMEVS